MVEKIRNLLKSKKHTSLDDSINFLLSFNIQLNAEWERIISIIKSTSFINLLKDLSDDYHFYIKFYFLLGRNDRKNSSRDQFCRSLDKKASPAFLKNFIDEFFTDQDTEKLVLLIEKINYTRYSDFIHWLISPECIYYLKKALTFNKEACDNFIRTSLAHRGVPTVTCFFKTFHINNFPAIVYAKEVLEIVSSIRFEGIPIRLLKDQERLLIARKPLKLTLSIVNPEVFSEIYTKFEKFYLKDLSKSLESKLSEIATIFNETSSSSKGLRLFQRPLIHHLKLFLLFLSILIKVFNRL